MAHSERIVAEIGLLLYPDAQLAAIHGLTDLFRIANVMVSAHRGESTPALRVSHWTGSEQAGRTLPVFDSHPGEAHRLSYIIVPPSLVMPGEMRALEGSVRWLSQSHASGTIVCSVCAGAFVLAATGLLEGRRATTHWAFAEQLAARYPAVRVDTDRMIIDDGDVITAGGILAWTDLGLTLVEKLLGPSVMLDTARFLLIDPPGRAQKPYGLFVPRFGHGDAAILKAQHWLHAAGGKDHRSAELAARAGLGERTFLRRFTKATGLRPVEYAQEIRVSKARAELELTRRPVAEIAWEVGYGDVSAFRKLFQRITGLAPNEYRRRFSVV